MIGLPWALTAATLARILAGVVVVLFVWPTVAFRLEGVAPEDARIARLGPILAWLMVGGYIAATAHLLGLAFVLLWLLAARLFFGRTRVASRYRLPFAAGALAIALDLLTDVGDASSRAYPALRAWIQANPLRAAWQTVSRHVRRPWAVAAIAALLAGSAYIRFAWNVGNAALLYSDAYETVAWMKGLTVGQVFPNGVYPQGYYLVMATLQTVTHASPMPFEKFFGPFIGLCMVLSVLWTTYRLSGNRLLPALAAAALYGLLPALLPYEAARQAASDAQEFGNALVLPLAWLVMQSWLTRARGYRLGAAAMLAAVGLTHPIALLNAALASIAGTVAAWLIAGIPRAVLRQWSLLAGAAAILSILPLAIGLIAHVGFLSTALPFATEAGGPTAPPLTIMEGVSLLGILALLGMRAGWRRDAKDLIAPLFALFLWLFAVGVDELPRVGISNLALTVRSGEFVALAEVVGIGLGVLALELACERWLVPGRLRRLGPSLLAVAVGSALLVRLPPVPLSAYTLDSDAFLAAFERIATTLPAHDWLTVAQDGYAFALNQGFNLEPTAWSADVSPATRWPRYAPPGLSAQPISEPYVFLFVQQGFHLPAAVPFASALNAQQRQANALLLHWVGRWEARYGPLPVYWHSRQLTVYYLREASAPPAP